MYSADFLSYCVMIHLLWPTRSYLYFNLKLEARIPMDDFEFSGLMSRDSSTISTLSRVSDTSNNKTTTPTGSEHSQLQIA